MLKRNLTILAVALSFSSQALAVETQELIEGRFGGLLTNAALVGDSVRGPQPTIPPVTLISKSGGGFLPPGSVPGAPGDDLPKLLVAAAGAMDKQLDGFSAEDGEITMRELGGLISAIYQLDAIKSSYHDGAKHLNPDFESLQAIAYTLVTAEENGYIESITFAEIDAMITAWYK